MNGSSIKQLLVFIFIFWLGIAICDAQTAGRRVPSTPEKSLFGHRSGKIKATKFREPKAARKAKDRQAKNKKKLKRDYKNFVEVSRKHAFNIQTPEVKARMKQNQKDINVREKARRKNTLAATRKAGQKYK